MELDNGSTLVTDTDNNKVEAPTVAADAQAAPVSAAPRLKSHDEYFAAHLAENKSKTDSQPARTDTPAAIPTPEKAPANSAAVAAPEPTAATSSPSTATTTTTTDTPTTAPAPLTVEEELAQAKAKLQQIEQARQAAEAKTLTERQQAELAQDKTYLDKTGQALDRKISQCQEILQQIAEAEAEEDFAEIRRLNQAYAAAYDEAQVLELNKTRFDREYKAKENYFQAQYAKTRESENQQTLAQIFKPFGLEAKAVLDKVPEQYRNNSFAVMDHALKQLAAVKDARIAELEAQVKTADEKANEKARAKWDSTNPASVPHRAANGGNSGEDKWSRDKGADYYFSRHVQNQKAAR